MLNKAHEKLSPLDQAETSEVRSEDNSSKPKSQIHEHVQAQGSAATNLYNVVRTSIRSRSQDARNREKEERLKQADTLSKLVAAGIKHNIE